MRTLLYYHDGFIRKAPLGKGEMIIGRGKDCDLVVDDPNVSRRHVKVIAKTSRVEVHDLESTNGLLVAGEKVAAAVIPVGGSFFLGSLEFYLRDSDATEFSVAKEVAPIFDSLLSKDKAGEKELDTHYLSDVLLTLLRHLLSVGLHCAGFDLFLNSLAACLEIVPDAGSMLLVRMTGGAPQVLFTRLLPEAGAMAFDPVLKDFGAGHSGNKQFAGADGEPIGCYSVPLTLGSDTAFLLALSRQPGSPVHPKIARFLVTLAREIELIHQILAASSRTNAGSAPAAELLENDGEIVTVSPAVRTLLKQTKRIAASDIFVLIQGESGTGKELLARLVHHHSKRRKGPLVALNCAAIPENLLEAELFGYEKGAFTGAASPKQGKLELASGGTLILDEVGDMPIGVQVKLLRALEEHEFYHLGGLSSIHVDLRIVALTNRPLKQLIAEKTFREDLYYRLAHHVVTMPPLRERAEDVAPLLVHFCNVFCQKEGKRLRGFSVKAFEALQKFSWPGNVRQLKNEVHRLVSLTDGGDLVSFDLLSEDIRYNGANEAPAPKFRAIGKPPADERDQVLMLLQKNQWNKSQTARDLGMTFQGLFKKLKRLGIERPSV